MVVTVYAFILEVEKSKSSQQATDQDLERIRQEIPPGVMT